jgi:hypothetical protein
MDLCHPGSSAAHERSALDGDGAQAGTRQLLEDVWCHLEDAWCHSCHCDALPMRPKKRSDSRTR